MTTTTALSTGRGRGLHVIGKPTAGNTTSNRPPVRIGRPRRPQDPNCLRH
jgi:hypothetical protein